MKILSLRINLLTGVYVTFPPFIDKLIRTIQIAYFKLFPLRVNITSMYLKKLPVRQAPTVRPLDTGSSLGVMPSAFPSAQSILGVGTMGQSKPSFLRTDTYLIFLSWNQH